MKVLKFGLERQIAFCLVAVLLAPVSALAAAVPQVAATPGTAATTGASPSPKPAAGQSTSNSVSAANSSSAPAGTGASAQTADQNQPTPDAPTAQQQQQNPPPPALGTAVAPYEQPSGVSGSKPAGAAIAAGKQRRTRSFAIRVALLVGAAVAIGVVTAATLSSPSRAN